MVTSGDPTKIAGAVAVDGDKMPDQCQGSYL
jgi:hypothetical protein